MSKQAAHARAVTSGPPRRSSARDGILLTLLALAVNLVWGLAIPPMDAPDEPAHLQAVRQVHLKRRLPEVHYTFERDPRGEIVDTDNDPATRQAAIRAGITDDFKLGSYESMQPPLYYLATGLAAPTTGADPIGVMRAGRVVSACFGAAAVGCLWLAARRFAPESPGWAVAAAGFVALLPQYAFNNASVSNDSSMNFASALALATWLGALRRPESDPRLFRSGAVVGLALLTKLSALVLLPGLGLLVLMRAWPGVGGWARVGRIARLGAWAGLGVLLISGWWFARNIALYDGDPTGSRQAIRYYQARFRPLDWNSADDWAGLGGLTWESFWGRFGWLTVRLPEWRYDEAKLVSVILAVLSLIALIRQFRNHARDRVQVQAGILLGVVLAGLLVSYLQFNFSVAFQAQARYLFPAILPMALALTWGLATLPGSPRSRRIAIGIFLAWMASLNATGLWTVGI